MEQMLEVNWCKQIMKKHFNKPLKMTDEDEANFQKAITCHIQYVINNIRKKIFA